MKKTVLIITAILIALSVLVGVLAFVTNNGILISLAITLGTIIFHIILRLFIGKIVPHNFKYSQKFFCEKPFEKKLYKALKVKKWKKYMPSFNPNTYSLELHSPEEIANTMCRNEIIHLTDVFASYIPISFGIFFGAYPVFIITSILASLFDLLFVFMQRFNRPRIVRLIKRKSL